MSCYSEERGTLLLPSSAVIPLRNTLVNAVNKQRAEWLDIATKIHAHLRSDAGLEDRKALSKILRGKAAGSAHGFSLSDFFEKKIEALLPPKRATYGFGFKFDTEDTEESYERMQAVIGLLLTPEQSTKAGEERLPRKLQAPKKKDLPPLLASKTWSFSNSDCHIEIDPDKRVLSWGVDQNNHAVDNAWNSVLGRTLSSALGKIKWTRATGGVFRYTDEYDRDAAMDGGGNAVSIRHAYGPLGEQEQAYSYGLGAVRRRSSPSRR